MRRLLVGTAALATLIACAGGSDSSTDTPEIINGDVDSEVNDAVVLVASPGDAENSFARCTGTVVAPNLVLTARHCVSKTDPLSLCKADGTASSGGRVLADKKASEIKILGGTKAADDIFSPVPRARAGIPSTRALGKKLIVEDTKTYCSHDVAFIVLDRDLDLPVAPMRLEGARMGELLTAIGWGYTEEGQLAKERMIRQKVPVKLVGPAVLGTGGTGVSASEFQVGEAFCQGDSGGPSLSSTGAVVGVVSRGGNGTSSKTDAAAGCVGGRTVNTYTHLGEKLDLVRQAFLAAGNKPILETAPPDAGAPDASDAGAEDAAPPFEVPVVEKPDAGRSFPTQPIASSGTVGGCSTAPGVADGGWLLGLAALAFGRRRRRAQ